MRAPILDPREALGAWHAEPLVRAVAKVLLERARAAQRACYRQGHDAFTPRLQEMIARFWLGCPVETDYLSLIGVTRGPQRALTELVHGQLLMSRKLEGARAVLDRGFGLAAPSLTAEEYLSVLARHERLAYLPLGPRPAPAQGLAGLLTEAAVIRRLRGCAYPRKLGDRCDTVG
jgi:hypothetical protein